MTPLIYGGVPERIMRIGGALLQISREVQLFAQAAPALDHLPDAVLFPRFRRCAKARDNDSAVILRSCAFGQGLQKEQAFLASGFEHSSPVADSFEMLQ